MLRHTTELSAGAARERLGRISYDARGGAYARLRWPAGGVVGNAVGYYGKAEAFRFQAFRCFAHVSGEV